MPEIHTLPRGDMIPWPGLNARRIFDPERMEELKASIREDGLGQPIGVKMNKKPPHWIYAGERRWRACEGILEEVPVHIRDLSEEAAIRMNLVENVQRNDLTPMEEAHALSRYLNTTKKTQAEVAQEIGKTQAWISNRVRLLRLSPELQTLLEEGAFSQSQARDLILPFSRLPDKLWDVLTGSVAKALKKHWDAGDEPLKDDELRLAVSKVAMSMSWWLDHHDYKADTQELFPANIHIPTERWSTAPAGTVISYLYGVHPNGSTSRAFESEWWQEEMNQAQADYQALIREMVVPNEFGEEGEGPDFPWSAALGKVPEDVEVPWNQRHVVYAPLAVGGELLADPTIIPDDCLVLWDRPGGSPQLQPVILCTQEAVFESAKASLEEKFSNLVERKTSRTIKKQVEASAQIKLQEGMATLLVVGTLIPEQPEILSNATEDLKISPTWWEIEEDQLGNWEEWTLALHTYLLKMNKKSLEALLKLLAYRLALSPDGSEMDPSVSIREAVANELREQLVVDLAMRMELPKWKHGAPAPAGKDEPEREEE